MGRPTCRPCTTAGQRHVAANPDYVDRLDNAVGTDRDLRPRVTDPLRQLYTAWLVGRSRVLRNYPSLAILRRNRLLRAQQSEAFPRCAFLPVANHPNRLDVDQQYLIKSLSPELL